MRGRGMAQRLGIACEELGNNEAALARDSQMVNHPAPQPENYSRNDDLKLFEDPELAIDFEDGVFYQDSVDEVKVDFEADNPMTLPSSTINKRKTSTP
ncbi:hypothetical protein D1007_20973 [Hordeum vulgare]|nr:hypothetical protein D1007_20973 [Hordeum vulgare]